MPFRFEPEFIHKSGWVERPAIKLLVLLRRFTLDLNGRPIKMPQMKSQPDYVYSEKQFQQIEGPFTFEQSKLDHSLTKRFSCLRRLFFSRTARLRERIFEYPLTIAALAELPVPCRIADVGGTSSLLPLELTSLGHEVHVLDLRPCSLKHPCLFTHQINLFDNKFEDNFFDAVTCISVIEHVGLPRYGGEARPDADFEMMKEFARLIRPKGRLIISAPYGKGHDPGTEGAPMGYRIYDRKRLEKLLAKFKIEKLRFAVIEQGVWLEKTQSEADLCPTSRPIKAVFFATLANNK
jgi:2-polyprenyl-3-methyl-5-hydroxy-6-metoxy-1,4-benzoquinol methylase